MKTLKEESEQAKKTEAEAAKKLKDLEYKVKHAKELKEKEMKVISALSSIFQRAFTGLSFKFQEADAEVKKCKKELAASKKQWTEKEAEEASLKLELKELEKSISDAEEQIRACDEAIKGFQEEMDKLQEELAGCREAVQAAKDAVKEQKEAVAKNNKEINSEHAKSDKIKKQNDERRLKAKEMEHKITKVRETKFNSTFHSQFHFSTTGQRGRSQCQADSGGHVAGIRVDLGGQEVLWRAGLCLRLQGHKSARSRKEDQQIDGDQGKAFSFAHLNNCFYRCL